MLELEAHYAHGVAHFGEQAELRYRNYAQVVHSKLETPDNVLRLRTALDSVKASEAAKKVANKGLEEANRELGNTIQIGERVRALHAKLSGEEQQKADAALRAVTQVSEAATKADAAYNVLLTRQIAARRANEARADAIAAATQASEQSAPERIEGAPIEQLQQIAGNVAKCAADIRAARDVAMQALYEARQAAAVPASLADGAAVPTSSPLLPSSSGSDVTAPSATTQLEEEQAASASSSAEASPDRLVDEIRAAAVGAASERDRTSHAADETNKLLESARENSNDADRALESARTEVTQALDALVRATVSLREAHSTAKEIAEEERRRQMAVQARSSDLSVRRAEHENAVSNATGAQAKLSEILDRTLPSHRAIVQNCLADGVENAQACILAQLSRQGAEAPGVAMVRCPAELPPGTSLVRSNGDLQTGELIVRGTGKNSACGAVSIERWVGLPRDQAGALGPERSFDHVALISASGRVLYGTGDDSALRIQTLSGVADQSLTSSMLRNVEIGTTRYRIFLQPLAVESFLQCNEKKNGSSGAESSDGQCTTNARLSLIGLVREDRLSTESYRVSPTSFLWAILLVGLGILSLPLAKLWFIGPRSRLKRFDVALLATSAVCVTLLAVVLTLTFAARNRLLTRLDGELRSVGDEAEGQLSARLEGGASMLNDFVRRSQHDREALRRLSASTFGPTTPSCAGAFAWLDGDDGKRTWPICELTKATLLGNVHEWRKAFWASEQGLQQIKYLPERIGTNAVNVAGRGYFQRAKAGRVECLASAGCAVGLEDRGTAEVVRSATSGDIVLVVARPTLDDELKVDGVAAVELPLEGLEAPVLPLGMQLAVVDEDGRIMLHSNNEAHHGQRLFDQVDYVDELRATLAARTNGSMVLRYLGVPSRAWLTPLHGTRWHIITVSPLAVADGPAAGMLLVTLAGFAGYVIAILLLAGCFTFGKGALRWLRPDPAQLTDRGTLSLRPDGMRTRAYSKAAVGLIVWSAFACGFVVCAGSSVPLIALLASSLLIGAILAVGVPGLGDGSEISFAGRGWARVRRLFSRRSDEPTPLEAGGIPADGDSRLTHTWRDDITLAYALCYFGLAGAFIAVPATIWFAGAYDHFAEGVVRAEQHHLARNLQYQHDCAEMLAGESDLTTRRKSCAHLFDGGLLKAPAQSIDNDAARAARTDARLPTASPNSTPSARTAGMVGRALSSFRKWLASDCSQLEPSWPLRCLVDSLPPFGALDGAASARLYRAQDLSSATKGPEVAWGWVRSPRELALVLPSAPRVQLVSVLPRLVDGGYNFSTLALLLSLFVFLVCSHTVAFHSMRRLFALDAIARWQQATQVDLDALLRDLASPARGMSGRKLLILYPPPQLLAALNASRMWAELSAVNTTAPLRYVPDVINLLSDEVALQLIAAGGRSSGSLLLLASADPFRRLPESFGARWVQALEPFEPVRTVNFAAAGENFSTATPPTPVPMSRARCERIWDESDEAERRMMGQLAIDGYANLAPENNDTLEQLTARGILGKHNLTFLNPAFARFVRTKTSAADLERWEQSDGGSVWNTVRVPLATSVAAALAIFGSSAPELTATGAALVPTIAAGFPAVLRVLLSLARGDTPGA